MPQKNRANRLNIIKNDELAIHGIVFTYVYNVDYIALLR
jgi:hypothetical protein